MGVLAHVGDGCGWVEDCTTWPLEPCGADVAYVFVSAVNGHEFHACFEHTAVVRTVSPQWVLSVRSA